MAPRFLQEKRQLRDERELAQNPQIANVTLYNSRHSELALLACKSRRGRAGACYPTHASIVHAAADLSAFSPYVLRVGRWMSEWVLELYVTMPGRMQKPAR